MIMGYYYGGKDDRIAQFIGEINKDKKIGLLKIEEVNDIDITQELNALVVGGAPKEDEPYWSKLRGLLRELPDTKILIQEIYCSKEDIRRLVGKDVNLDFLNKNIFYEEICQLRGEIK